MVGRDTSKRYTPEARPIGDVVLEVRHLSVPRRFSKGYLLEDVTFNLRAGEILGLYGLMGAGRTELFECLMGLQEYESGTVALNGQTLNARQVRHRIEQGLMLVPEDRQREGLVQCLSVRNNMLLASLKSYLSGPALSRRKETQAISRYVDELSIKVANVDNLISSLSGGNQQKVVVGKALLTRPKVLLMDEPTRGIDVGAKQEIFDIVVQLAKQGLGIIFVSTELKEVLAISDRIIVMSKGKITREFNRADANEHALVEASAIGHGVGSHNGAIGA
jgi:erythritol transport system ATP-binding protein